MSEPDKPCTATSNLLPCQTVAFRMNPDPRDYDHFGSTDAKRMPSWLFSRAQHLDFETAQRADVTKQSFSVCPRFWYVDASYTCADCGREFFFSAREQRFWYETLGFRIEAEPIYCAQCRKKRRSVQELRNQYDAKIADVLGKCPLETKQQMVDVINKLEEIQGQIPNPMREKRARLCQQIAKALHLVKKDSVPSER